jgi:ribonuclease HII
MELKEVKRLISLCQFEDDLYSNGFLNIAGVDEVGRGSLAGPIVAAAVILKRDKIFIEKLNDSKKIPKQNRDIIFKKIVKSCSCWSIAKVSPKVIDKISLQEANILVIKKAIKNLKIKPDIILVDALNPNIKKLTMPIIKGDELSATIAAASIIAKVIRDRLMIKMSRIYPEYGFDFHKGYGTEKHLKMLAKYGPCEIHRVSFKGVLNQEPGSYAI